MTELEKKAWQRLEWVLTKEELNRFCMESRSLRELTVSVDLHGLKCREAQKLVHDTMLLIRGEFELVLIHGYRGGCALRDMLWYGYENNRIAGRRFREDNPGVTEFMVA